MSSLPTLKGREFTVSALYLRVHISVVGWMPIINRPRYFSVLEVELIPNLLSHYYFCPVGQSVTNSQREGFP